MIERARATGLYAELEVADMVQGCAAGRTPAPISFSRPMRWSIFPTCAGVAEAARVLAPAACWPSRSETHGGEGVILGHGLRYAHGASYVRASLPQPASSWRGFDDLSARNEDHVPVPGLVVVANS